MARFRLLSDDELDPDLRSWLSGSKEDLTIRRDGHTPELAKAFEAFYHPVKYGGRLSPELKELLRLKVAELNDCAL